MERAGLGKRCVPQRRHPSGLAQTCLGNKSPPARPMLTLATLHQRTPSIRDWASPHLTRSRLGRGHQSSRNRTQKQALAGFIGEESKQPFLGVGSSRLTILPLGAIPLPVCPAMLQGVPRRLLWGGWHDSGVACTHTRLQRGGPLGFCLTSQEGPSQPCSAASPSHLTDSGPTPCAEPAIGQENHWLGQSVCP